VIYKNILYIGITLLSISLLAQENNGFFKNGKVSKFQKTNSEGKITEVCKYLFFNGKTVEFNCKKTGVIGKEYSFSKDSLIEKKEIVILEKSKNIVSNYYIYFTGLSDDDRKFNGRIAKEYTSKNGYRETAKFHHPNGNLKETGNYLLGSRQGLWKTFYRNGVLRSEENWKKNKREATAMFYHNNGNLSSVENYKNNQQIGEWKFYDYGKNKKLTKIGRYPKKSNSKVSSYYEIDDWEFYDKNEKLLRIKRFNYKTDEWEFFDTQGNKINWSDD